MLIYPVCDCCNNVVKKKRFGLCEKCFYSVTHTSYEARCKYCSYPLASGSNVCGRCFKEARDFDRGFFLFPYNDCGRSLIHSIKFRDKIEYLRVMECFEKDISVFLKSCGIEVITYVPSSLYHYLSRGYTVPREIAKILSKSFSIPYKKLVFTRRPFKKLLSKTRSVSQRRSIVKDFFRVKSKNRFKNVLLIDDVFTTGTTINTIAKLLKKEGVAERVFFLTLSMVVK